jgi:signal transduction histidine kinase
MNRPAFIWSVFGFALAALLAAMAAVTVTAVRLDRAQAEAQSQAGVEERVRLALWRIDSAVAPLLLQESSRPYFTYTAFFPAERAYDKMFRPVSGKEALLPSPLLTQTSSNVLLHFQYGPEGALTSPQVPARRDLALAHTDARQLDLASKRLDELRGLVSPSSLAVACVTTLSQPVPVTPTALVPQMAQIPQKGDPVFANQQQQIILNRAEQQARAQNYAQTAQLNQLEANPLLRGDVAEGTVKPIWFGDALVLARRVSVEGREYVQGCWLDWPRLKSSLLASVSDLLPTANLEPVRDAANDPQARMLTSLPLRLAPGSVSQLSTLSAQLPAVPSPMKIVLAVSWLCLLLAAVAVGVLLHGAVSLSERRGAFVSAVTHELRTPLTTFKMYSEMLAEGMVQDEDRKRQYLNTLCSEANRLGHLVENVLAYARLERGSARSRVESLSLAQLIDRVKPRLAQRAEQAEMRLQVDGSEQVLQSVVHVDVAAVEQILFNLVDNACKYAAPAASAAGSTDKIIHLEAFPDSKFAMLRVRDHGQGISEEGARRLFKPFSKSAHEAAHTAPGVGLGLALCRRLSRSMGGDLRLDRLVKNGACFVLSLPLSDATRPASIA